jgi:phosphatidylglycerophosphate synthase
LVTSSYRIYLDELTAIPARWLARMKVTPNVLTLIGLGGTVASCLYYLITRETLIYCGLLLAWGACDLLDGAVARLTGQTTRWGSYLDAMADRYAEAAVALTVAWVTGHWLLIGVVVVGALLTSYAKARASMEVQITNREWPDLLERGERSLVFVAGLGGSAMMPRLWLGHDLFWWTLVALAAAIHMTVVQRMWRARHLIRTRTTT